MSLCSFCGGGRHGGGDRDGSVSVTIHFGDWTRDEVHEYSDGRGGQIWRRGFAIIWGRPVEQHVLFALRVLIRINEEEFEQAIMLRDLGPRVNGRTL